MRKAIAIVVGACGALASGCQGVGNVGNAPSPLDPYSSQTSTGYLPVYYQGNEVLYDDGQPYFLLNDRAYYIPPSDPRYRDYVEHYRIERGRERRPVDTRARARNRKLPQDYGEDWPMIRTEHEREVPEHARPSGEREHSEERAEPREHGHDHGERPAPREAHPPRRP